MLLVGVDIGGTKISVTLGDEKGNVSLSTRLKTASFSGAKEGLQGIIQEIKNLLKQNNSSLEDIEAIGVASPGPIDTKKGIMITPPNLPSWHHKPIVAPIEKSFQKRVYFNNDANGAALAEYHFGHLKGTQNLIYLTASTGMGGGIIVHGKLLQGITDTGGEVGHIILDRDGPLCPCGLRGCFEAFCGGKNVALQVQKELEESTIKSSIREYVNKDLSSIDMTTIVKAVKEQDEYACSKWNEFLERMAQGIGALLLCFNPEAILLGTIAVHAKELMMHPLKEKLPKYSWVEPLAACKIEPSKLGSVNHQLSPLAIAKEGIKG